MPSLAFRKASICSRFSFSASFTLVVNPQHATRSRLILYWKLPPPSGSSCIGKDSQLRQAGGFAYAQPPARCILNHFHPLELFLTPWSPSFEGDRVSLQLWGDIILEHLQRKSDQVLPLLRASPCPGARNMTTRLTRATLILSLAIVAASGFAQSKPATPAATAEPLAPVAWLVGGTWVSDVKDPSDGTVTHVENLILLAPNHQAIELQTECNTKT